MLSFDMFESKVAFCCRFGYQKGDLLILPQLLTSSTHVKSLKLYKPRKDKITGFHYFKTQLHGNQVFLM